MWGERDFSALPSLSPLNVIYGHNGDSNEKICNLFPSQGICDDMYWKKSIRTNIEKKSGYVLLPFLIFVFALRVFCVPVNCHYGTWVISSVSPDKLSRGIKIQTFKTRLIPPCNLSTMNYSALKWPTIFELGQAKDRSWTIGSFVAQIDP